MVIGIIWTFIYPIIIVTYSIAFWRIAHGKLRHMALYPLIINLIANAAFTYIQFGLKNLTFATADIIIVWLTIIWSIAAMWHQARVLAYWQFPYLAWVTIASILQISITLANR